MVGGAEGVHDWNVFRSPSPWPALALALTTLLACDARLVRHDDDSDGSLPERDGGAEPIRFQVSREAGAAFRPQSQAVTEAAMAALRDADFSIVQREDRPTRTKPNAPFITSTLQQAASTRLSFSVKKTMTMDKDGSQTVIFYCHHRIQVFIGEYQFSTIQDFVVI